MVYEWETLPPNLMISRIVELLLQHRVMSFFV